MKLSKIIPVVLLMGGISTLALSCQSKAPTTTTTTQVVTVGRGNLSLAITAVGNLALSVTQNVAFQTGGTVQQVNVNVGDTVKAGQLLATLDPTAWNSQVMTAQRLITTDNRSLTAKQNALRDAQIAIQTAQSKVTGAQYSVTAAQLKLQKDADALNQQSDVQKLQDQITAAQNAITTAQSSLAYGGDVINAMNTINNAKAALYGTNGIGQYSSTGKLAGGLLAQMTALLAGYPGIASSADSALAIANAGLLVQQDQLAIDQANTGLQTTTNALGDAQNAITPAQEDIQYAQQTLATDQQNLITIQANSPQVTAPFDGFVTGVTAVGGTAVNKGAIAVTIADPTKFQAVVMVNETDISKIKMGQFATIVPQASTSNTYTANVTQLAPTATIQQGVVNYQVTVGVQSLEAIGQALRQFTGNATSGNGTSGRPGAGGGTGLAGDNLTQAQIQALQQRTQAGGGGFGGGGGFTRGSQAATSSSPATFALASGMTVTVTIPYQTRTNVLLVPNAAITTSGGQSSVKVVSADNTTAVTAIQTGISDSQNTEVTSGLTLGEKVQITRTSNSGTTAPRTSTPAGGGIPGLGGGAFRVGG